MDEPSKIHNAQAGAIVRAIVQPVIDNNGTAIDILVLTESVLVGVALFVIKLGGDEAVLDVLLEGAKDRLAEIRLTNLPTEGAA